MDWYLPGYKAGGPVRTVANMVSQLAGELEFWIVTRDRDLGEARPYAGIRAGAWNEVAGAHVRYLSPAEVGMGALVRLCRSTAHDAVYLNSFFSRLSIAYLLARWVGAVPGVPVVLAPRGEFAQAALAIRARRKRLYLRAASRLGLLRAVRWQASAEHERADVQAALRESGAFSPSTDVVVAPDLVGRPAAGEGVRPAKVPSRARFLFLSRVSPMKNLHTAIRLLNGLGGEVSLEVHGPIGDPGYWSECEREGRRLPGNVTLRYHGPVSPEEVGTVMRRHDFLLLPTLGENFGHVIAEALVAGTPVVLSDRTSWGWIAERDAGWCIPLADEPRWRQVLQSCVDMEAEAHAAMCAAAAAVGGELATSSEALGMNRRLFDLARFDGVARQAGSDASRM